jgi:hypothetical protein
MSSPAFESEREERNFVLKSTNIKEGCHDLNPELQTLKNFTPNYQERMSIL